MAELLRALMVEDSEDDQFIIVRELQRGGFTVEARRVATPDELRESLASGTWDVVLCDHALPLMDSFDALRLVRQSGVDVPFIVVSGTIGEELAVAVMKAGANDYLLKGSLNRLVPAVRRENTEAAGREARRRAEAEAARESAARRQLEEQLRQSLKMEAIGRLAGGVAHDFNNLLAVILGFGELLLDEIGPDPGPRERLRLIIAAAESASSLTRQLLVFSRRQETQLVETDLATVVEPLGMMLRRFLGEDIRIVTSIAPKLGVVRVDPSQIEQIVMNLATNARDAMPRGGALSIELTNQNVDADVARVHPRARAGPTVRLSISDTGVGMDEVTAARIFEPFFTTKAADRGTGLGLAVVYGIVEQSGGWITVNSQVGKGTVFNIYFPRVGRKAIATRARQVISPVPKGAETILLVEDAADLRQLAFVVLESLGYHVLVAEGGVSAMQVADDYGGPIHLLLSDVVMPGMSGSDLATRLKSRMPGLKVLFMSGFTDDMVVVRGAATSGQPFLQKPFIPRTLARKVRDVLDARAATRS